MKGTLKWYNRVKGYGFIEEGGSDVFFHHTGFAMDKKTLAQLEHKTGAAVEFEDAPSEKGRKAVNVKLLEESKP